jgi:hypothetical protein
MPSEDEMKPRVFKVEDGWCVQWVSSRHGLAVFRVSGYRSWSDAFFGALNLTRGPILN